MPNAYGLSQRSNVRTSSDDAASANKWRRRVLRSRHWFRVNPGGTGGFGTSVIHKPCLWRSNWGFMVQLLMSPHLFGNTFNLRSGGLWQQREWGQQSMTRPPPAAKLDSKWGAADSGGLCQAMEDTVGRVVADFGAVTFISNRQQVANMVRLQRESAALVATQ
mmetsp:Transcript_40796/g.75525  ORF Transcript_40796/g.75525 Transcript_40796/m.75525 type:complete len:163 (-) Transcript_40796:602-1090(-)